MDYKEYVSKNKDIVAMIHLKPMPGTVNSKHTPDQIIAIALEEARVYKRFGIRTVMIENMHDVPYVRDIPPEVPTVMAIIAKEVKRLGMYCGVQILSAGHKEALAVAHAAGADFVRVEAFVFAHIGDEGYFESCAGELLRYRKQIGAENILVFTDINKKHSSHTITSDISLLNEATTAQFFHSDGIIITGECTGKETSVKDLEEVKGMDITTLIGSGITPDNFHSYIGLAGIFIIGSYFKKDGHWANELDEDRIGALMKEFERLKS